MSDVNSNSLAHSNGGISVLNQFYGTNVMLYVEGDDDIPFWDNLFRRFSPPNFYTIEQTHGKEVLQTYINGIKDGTLSNVMVACDSDYSALLETEIVTHPLIVTTFGHSIENTMFCIPMLASYICRLKKTTENLSASVSTWIHVFEDKGRELLKIDVLNALKPRGQSCKCLNKGFPRFSDGKGYFDDTKLSTFLHQTRNVYTEDERGEVEEKLNASSRPIYKVIQGHFIEGATNEYIRKEAGCSLSRSAIYAEFSYCRRLCDNMCEDLIYVKTEIENAVQHLNSQ